MTGRLKRKDTLPRSVSGAAESYQKVYREDTNCPLILD